MKALKVLNKYFLKYKWRLLLGACFVTLSNLFGIFPAQMTRNALDMVADNLAMYNQFDNFKLQRSVYEILSSTILLFGLIVLAMALIKGIFMFFMRQTIIVVSRLIEYDMKNEIYNHYQQLDQPFYSSNNTGDLMNRISEDVGRVRMYVGPAIMYTINLIVMFVLVIGTMLSINARLTFYALLPLPILVFIVYYVHDIINVKSEKVQEKLSDLSTFVQEVFSGIRVIKSFVREKSYLKKYGDQSEEYKKVSMNLVQVNALFMPAIFLLIGISIILTIYIGSLEVMNGRLSIGNIAEFVIYVNMLTWPVASLGWVVTLIQRAAASQERINEFLNIQPAVKSGSTDIGKLKGKIEFKNVGLTYTHTGIKALRNVNFCVEPGKSLAIIGRTGSGKTSIVKLLLRLIDPTEGKIYVDNAALKNLNLDVFRSQTGCVPQDVFLFSDSIINNISFGLQQAAANEEVKIVAQQAGVYNDIIHFAKGFETVIGERGITLSGGQKQRVSIARALIRNPQLLILDDCLSAVDALTEERILASLRKTMADKTTILISHRVSAVKNADHILVLDKGEIAEQGTHNELILLNGIYASIYEMQLVEEAGAR